MSSKVVTLSEAVKLVSPGDMVCLGGNVLHRAPMAFTRELIRNNVGNLRVVKTAGGHEVDILCGAELVTSVDAGFISYESEYGLATFYRKSVESGNVKGNEHACYTVICALRAAAYGVPFMPVKGLMYGDLLIKNDYFKVVEDPFGNGNITLVKALNPDIAIIHVQECDKNGNSIIYGPKYDDVLMSRAAKKVIITTEQIVHESKIKANNMDVDIPGFLVNAVVHTPKGASPCSCYKKYDVDNKVLREFINKKTKEEILHYVDSYEKQDRFISSNRGWM